jgi:CheY-like chemotaxis protein
MALQVMDRVAAEPAHRRVVDAAMRATRRAAELVRQMLTFGRAQPLQPAALDFADFLLKNHELLGKAVSARIALDAAVEPGLPPLYVDPAQLELALLNLVFNARDALPEGGHITIGAHAAPDAGPSMARIEVRDDGIGMDERTRAKALEPYFTTKPIGQGSGLGLAQVHAFAEQSGGRVSIESTPGHGTAVTMLLPCVEAGASAPCDVPAEGGASGTACSRRVLMVEDDVLVASVVTTALHAAGHEVTLCTTADEALAQLALPAPPYDVLFSDVVMPGAMSGVDLVQWCREHRPSVGCVTASGYAGPQAGGGSVLLVKPYALGDLLQAIDEAARAGGGKRDARPSDSASEAGGKPWARAGTARAS